MLHGGRTLRIPIVERVSRVDLTTIPIDVTVRNAYSKGGIPLIVQGIANVKVSARDPIAHNAVERLLEKPFEEMMHIAKDTLEGNLRGVLATLTPEEANEDRLKFAGRLIEEADEDLKKLGLELDTLKIQNLTDEVNYLDSIGRQQTAEILKKARVAEAERASEAEQTEASARQAAQVAQIQADLAITEENNRLRVRKAELDAEALAREAEAKVSGEKARVVAEQELQQERIAKEQRRLEADREEILKARIAMGDKLVLYAPSPNSSIAGVVEVAGEPHPCPEMPFHPLKKGEIWEVCREVRPVSLLPSENWVEARELFNQLDLLKEARNAGKDLARAFGSKLRDIPELTSEDYERISRALEA